MDATLFSRQNDISGVPFQEKQGQHQFLLLGDSCFRVCGAGFHFCAGLAVSKKQSTVLGRFLGTSGMQTSSALQFCFSGRKGGVLLGFGESMFTINHMDPNNSVERGPSISRLDGGMRAPQANNG